MPRCKRKGPPLPAMWRRRDGLWIRIEPILAELDPPNRTGCKRINARAPLGPMTFRPRTGSKRRQLRKELPTIVRFIAR